MTDLSTAGPVLGRPARYVLIHAHPVWASRFLGLTAIAVGCAFIVEGVIEGWAIQAAAGLFGVLAGRFFLVIAPIGRQTYVVGRDELVWLDASGRQQGGPWSDLTVERLTWSLPLPPRGILPVYRLSADGGGQVLIAPHLLAMDLAQRRQLSDFLQRRASEARIQSGA